MKKIIQTFFSFALLLMLGLVLIGCKQPSEDPNPDPTDDQGTVMDYFPTSTMNSEKKLYVIGGFGVERLGRHKFITASAFEGLMNRTEVSYYVNYDIMKEGVSSSQYWLDQLVAEYGLTTEDITYEDMIATYKTTFGEDAGYILYDDQVDSAIGLNQTRSLTAAVNMAAIRGWLPIVKDLEDEAITLGLTKKLDVTEKDEKWVFDNYKEEFNNDILIQQRPFETATLPMVPLRDYAVANKFFTFYEPGISASDIRFRTDVHEWAEPNMPILGWGPGDEAGHIGFASQFGQFPIPSDFSMNLSVFNADIFAEDTLTQKNEFTPITPESGKHYVAIARSDGDNISVWANEFPLSSTDFMGAADGTFPMGWSIQPSLIDLAPGMMNILYKSASPYDNFIAPVSGHGYIYPSTYPTENYDDWFATMDDYLNRTDLKVVEVLDAGQGDILSKDVINQYAKSDALIGGINLNGYRYAGGRGAVVWSDNGKPFVSPRESLWTESKELVAARINSYTKDYTQIEGYTFINLHPWSHTYQDVEWVIDNLDEDVVVVTPEQLLDLISKNVAHVDKTTLDSSGNPIEVPVNPLHNKFLLDTEDWTGNATFSNGMLKVTGSATKTYTLPEDDDQFIEFSYQGVASNSVMNVSLTIDGVEKTLVNGLPVSSAEGLNTLQLPLNAYYSPSDYQGKEVTLTVTLADSASQIKIDEVITSVKTNADATSDGDMLNDNFDNGLEDWYTTSFEKGAAVKSDNGMMMIDGSDGWTGLFNANVNNAAVKYFTLPDADKISFSFSVRSSDTGTDVKAYLLIDGEVVELTDGYQYISNFETVNFMKVLQGYAGKNAVLVFEQKDSNQNNGIGEVCYIQQLSIGEYVVDPSNNRFDVDLEDWNVASGNVTSVPGFMQIVDNVSIQKDYAFEVLTGNFEYQLKLLFQNASDLEFRVVLKSGDTVLGETTWATIEKENIVSLKDFADQIEGQTVTVVVETSGTGTALLDQFVVDQEWITDPYNNQFEQNMEDWTMVSATGWENNKVYRDPNWPRLQFTYALNGTVTAEKSYTLLGMRNQVLEFSMEGLGNAAGMLYMTLTVNGIDYVIYDAQIASGLNIISIYLDKVDTLSDVTFEGQDVTVTMTVTQMADGAGDCFMAYFKTKEYAEVTIDPYNNTFLENMEDWTVTETTGWESNGASKDPDWDRIKMTYALDGSVSLEKAYQLLDMTNQMIELSLEGLGDAAGMITITITIGDTDYTLYDAQIANGRNTIELKLDELLTDVTFANQNVTITLSISQMTDGSGDAFLWSFVTKEYVSSVVDPYNNTFTAGMEDWIVTNTTGWESNGAKKDPNWPRMQFTFALEGSVTVEKTYQLLNLRNQMLELSLEGSGDAAGMLNLTLSFDGNTYVLYDAQIANGVNTVQVKLDELLTDVLYQGQEVTLTLTVSQITGGAGDAYLWSFVTKEYVSSVVNPYNNTFANDMEDWTVANTTGWESNGAVKDPNWPRLQITYALNGSVTLEKTYTLLANRQQGFEVDLEGVGGSAGMLEFVLVVGEVEYSVYDAQIQNSRNTLNIDLSTVTALDGVTYEGQEVTLKMVVTQITDGAGDCYLWGFVTKEIQA